MAQEQTGGTKGKVDWPDTVLEELASNLSDPFSHGLLSAYLASPSQETIERYLDCCRRLSPTQGTE